MNVFKSILKKKTRIYDRIEETTSIPNPTLPTPNLSPKPKEVRIITRIQVENELNDETQENNEQHKQEEQDTDQDNLTVAQI